MTVTLRPYEVLHIQNSSQQDIKFHFEGEAFNVDERWYYDFFWINLPTFQIQGSNENFGPVNTDEEDLVIKAGESKIFLTNYAPTGKKIKNARLNAVINGQKISSTNTLSSDVELEIGKAYHMYATWDGKELKFGKEDIRETIIYPTSSYQLSEDGKTLVKWLGEETEIDMSADPAFDEVEIIGYKAFAWSTAKTIKLSNKAKEIEQWAFNYASTKKIYLPKSITTIAYEAFAKCTDLEEVHITDLSAWCKIRFTDAWSNPFTYASSLFVNNDKIVDLVIPDDIDKIGKYTFRGADIETVTMSDNVTDIGEDAFSFCENLKRIQFSSNLAVIDYCAFRGCKSLEEVWLPESLNYLGDMSFDLCNKIRTVYIGKNLHYIGFSFRCSNLENFIVSNQNKYLFAVDGILYSNVFKYSTETNDYILDHASLTCYPGGRSDNSYTLPDFAIYIQDFAFMQSKNLTTVILHSGMTEIGSLNYLFNETEVPNLNKVIIYATTPPSSYSGHSGTHSYEYGYGINPHTTLYVPSESVDTYKADENWGKFGTILPLGSGMPDDDADVIDDDPAEDPFGD